MKANANRPADTGATDVARQLGIVAEEDIRRLSAFLARGVVFAVYRGVRCNHMIEVVYQATVVVRTCKARIALLAGEDFLHHGR
jgi:hypothetical protein